MRLFLLLFSVFFLFPVFLFSQSKKGELKLTAHYANFTKDTIWIKNNYNEKLDFMVLDSLGKSAKTITLSKGFYKISDGENYFIAFLQPAYNLSYFIDVKRFDSSIVFSGKGSAENNYLKYKNLLENSISNIDYYGEYALKNEAAFLKFSDSIYNLKLTLFNQYKKKLNAEFAKLELVDLHSELRRKWYNYPSMHGFLTEDKTFKVSTDFPNPFKDIDLVTQDLYLSSNYRMYVISYFESLASEDKKNKKETDYYTAYIKRVKSDLNSLPLMEHCAYELGKYRLAYTKSIDTVYAYVMSLIQDEQHAEEIKTIYFKLKNIVKGAVSPSFSFQDAKGQTISLDQFKGKFVYIDVWSTWCLPCIKEIPFQKSMEDSFHSQNIVFISICRNSGKSNWLEFIKKENLHGVQLFAESFESDFFKAYGINGVPHYILIDAFGNIVDADAKRPSDPNLMKELTTLLVQ